MIDIGKTITALVIALLYFFFVYSLIEVVYSAPEYEDYCRSRAYPLKFGGERECPTFIVSQEAVSGCQESGGEMQYTYNETGCATGYECDSCYSEYKTASEKYNKTYFLLSSIFGIIAIVSGLVYSKKEIEWIINGFMLGGFMLIFIGTIRYFSDMAVFLRPFVMLAEMSIVIYAAYRKIND